MHKLELFTLTTHGPVYTFSAFGAYPCIVTMFSKKSPLWRFTLFGEDIIW